MELIAAIAGVILAGIGAWIGYLQYRVAKRLSSTVNVKEIDPKPADASSSTDSDYREWLAQEVAYIDVRGIKVGQDPLRHAMRFPLEALFTEPFVRLGPTNFDIREDGSGGVPKIPLTQLLVKARKVCVVGGPGLGKTTLLRHTVSRVLTKEPEKLPVLVDLSEFIEFVALNHTKCSGNSVRRTALEITVDHFLRYVIDPRESGRVGLSKEILESYLEAGNCVWLFDSFDEISSDSARVAVSAAMQALSRRWSRCSFIVASRPTAMTGEAIPLDFDVVEIEAFTDDQVNAFLRSWSSVLIPGLQERERFSQELYATITSNSELTVLSRTPVMLTCMAVLHYNGKHLPEGKADLLEAVIQWLIRSRDEQSRPEGETPKFIEACYRHLAMRMVTDIGGIRLRVGRQWAAEQIMPHFSNETSRALQFLTREEEQTGILVRKGEGDVTFWHSWFSQYLAAKEIAGKTDDENSGWWSVIRDHLEDREWTEILQLVPACLLRLGSDRVDLFFERVSKSAGSSDIQTKIARVGLGGRILRDLDRSGYSANNVPAWCEILGAVKCLFHDDHRTIALGARYEAAAAYSLSMDGAIEDSTNWIDVPAGDYMMGAQSGNIDEPNFDEFAVPWEEPVVRVQLTSFEIARVPTTVDQYRRFVSAGGYSNGNWWTEDAWRWLKASGITRPLAWESQLSLLNSPVTGLSWFEANAFCTWLTAHSGNVRMTYRLPSEAEWEYATRRLLKGGMRFWWGDSISYGDLSECNWGGSNLRRKSPVGMFPMSNSPDGICDLIGNVEEWCGDSFTDAHMGYPVMGQARVIPGEVRRVVRGGSTIRFMRLCRPTYRSKTYEMQRYPTIGFRIVRTAVG
jgi:formylglycine-generating enzyme required for sulfatase activity